ncbi:winged helix-turn-helix transcriptional regulator [Sellimonas catena]|uniref:ATP-dependent DNA helicase RecG n=1 Tax=Sellimonas catena TaxID=2994035 RepID=A0A9W6C9N3_9FIRM|nr:winged helix-turn-helix transcriptional regulator [Sellimonas catena]MEE0781310.1 winged helix-turn-helix transcriptional regulator [Sellimonas sp.]GLG90018.1 ATP-dependent DNA helicase RecG [Sellimonas catena]
MEFKRCGNGIESDVYETVCSFLNRFGGDIFLGVLDDGTVLGVPENAAADMVRNFISCVSNPALFTPTVYLSPKVLKYEGKTSIHIHVLPSAEVHSYKKIIYDRIDDADVKVTATSQIAQMYIRKQEIFTERKLYPYVKKEDLRIDMLPKLRIMAENQSNGSGHPWSRMTDDELLKSARLYSIDRVTGEQGFNLAAVMLLGKDDVILDIVPAYVTDALLRRVNIDRYDDREIIQTNLIESYERLMEFGHKHLLDKFFLEDDQRKSLRNIITREMIANTLIHREYTSSYQAKFVIEKERMYVENANRASQNIVITPDNMEPIPKNPIIASFFRNIGYADQLGSGVRNLFKYSKFYSGNDPEFIEGDIFKIIVPLDEGNREEQTTQSVTQTTQSVTQTTQSKENDPEKNIMELIEQNPFLSQKQMAEKLNLNKNTLKYYIKKMKEKGVIERVGTNRKGKWIVKS